MDTQNNDKADQLRYKRNPNFLDYLKKMDKLTIQDKNVIIEMHNEALGIREEKGKAIAKNALAKKLTSFLNKTYRR